MMMCDIVIAADNSIFSSKEITLGVIPGGGGTVRLTSSMGKSNATQLLLTG